jgi:hypothetical protein
MRSGRSGVSMIHGGTISGTSGRSSRNSQSTTLSSREGLVFWWFLSFALTLTDKLNRQQMFCRVMILVVILQSPTDRFKKNIKYQVVSPRKALE